MDLDDQELEATKRILKKTKEEELEKLRTQLFMLKMQDHWDADDYKFEDEILQEIKKLTNSVDKI